MTELTPVERLTRDIKEASVTLSADEARFLVDAYYSMQDQRKRTGNQVRSMDEEPHRVLGWLNDQSDTLEKQVKRALDAYTDAQPIGKWAREVYGVGPVITAGLIAHIDIEQAPTVGHIWRYAGLDPSSTWNKGEKRPWNADLKTLCWKIGQSFMKFHNQEACFYGKIYSQRKAYEVDRNESGGNTETAAKILTVKKIGKATEAFKHLSKGVLPPGQIDARARRYAVKLFLSHLQLIWWTLEHDELPPKPYILTQEGGHAHMILPPNMPQVVADLF